MILNLLLGYLAVSAASLVLVAVLVRRAPMEPDDQTWG